MMDIRILLGLIMFLASGIIFLHSVRMDKIKELSRYEVLSYSTVILGAYGAGLSKGVGLVNWNIFFVFLTSSGVFLSAIIFGREEDTND